MPKAAELVSLRSHGRAFLGVAVLSALVNLLHLSGSVFMMEVYDRVLPSRSLPTLVGLAAILVMLYLFQATFDIVRARILSRIGASLDENLGETVFQLVMLRPIRGAKQGDGQQPLRDLEQIRGFLAGGGPAALFDLPWMPLYLTICFAFHFWIGMTALLGAVVLVCLTLLTEGLTRRTSQELVGALQARSTVTGAGQRNAEVIYAMGMAGRVGRVWAEANCRVLAQQQRVSDVGGGLGAVSRMARMLLQSSVLAVGACLVMGGEVTSGVMIASSILSSRALAPVETAIANWKGFVAARHSRKRLGTLLQEDVTKAAPMPLPAPNKSLAVEGVGVGAPGTRRLLVDNVSFSLRAGEGLGIIGPSASGKSTMARTIVGVWPNLAGKIGSMAQHLTDICRSLGRHIGYLPQDVELFAGSIAQNIARFEREATSDAVIAAARAADVHEMILRLPQGYDTEVGEAGAALSGGQRQRIALARALFGDPFLVVLDEPNSNLDNEGDHALAEALLKVRARGGIVVVVAHRPSALASVDKLLVMGAGKQVSFGPKDEVMGKYMKAAGTPTRMPNVTPIRSAPGGGDA